MIYDTLTNSHLYYGISARLQKALDFLVNSDFSTIPDGRYEIDGNDVFAIHQMQKLITHTLTFNILLKGTN